MVPPFQRRRRRVRTSCCAMALGFVCVTTLARIQISYPQAEEGSIMKSPQHFLNTARRLVHNTNMNETQPLRILSFASSSATSCGQGFEQSTTYPRRLRAQTVVATGSTAFRAACTQSIVGDEELYDVVTMELSEPFDEAHVVLAERIRTRFPDAMIVLVQLWRPMRDIVYTHSQGVITLAHWNVANRSIHANELAFAMMQAGPEHWSVRLDNDGVQLLLETVRRLNAKLVTLPVPNPEAFAFPQTLRTYLDLFNDQEQLSARGHFVLARAIQRLLVTFQPKSTLSSEQLVNTWGAGDVCHVWNDNARYAPSTARRLELASARKHPLSLHRPRFVINNPFGQERRLYLTYMTASDQDDGRIYPRVRVRLNHRPSVVVDPYHEFSEHEQVTRTTAVGIVAPGQTTISLDPLEDSTLGFRLVGASLLSDEVVDRIPMDFALELGPARLPTHGPFW
jgi:hypothetical protein